MVVRVPYRLELAGARVETTAGHGVDLYTKHTGRQSNCPYEKRLKETHQSLSFVDVVREPHVLSLGGLHRLHGHDLHLAELKVTLADKVRLDDVVAVPRPDAIPLRAAPFHGSAVKKHDVILISHTRIKINLPEQSLPHLLDAFTFRHHVGHVGVLAHLILRYG